MCAAPPRVFRVRERHLTEAYLTYTARRVLVRGSASTTGSDARSCRARGALRLQLGQTTARAMRYCACAAAPTTFPTLAPTGESDARAMRRRQAPLAPLPPHWDAHLPPRGSTRGQCFGRSAVKTLCSPAVVHGAVFPAVVTVYSTVVRAPPIVTCGTARFRSAPLRPVGIAWRRPGRVG